VARAEPFRLFFPLAVLLGWVGIGHWVLYWRGITTTYSCLAHGLLQTQSFLMAFAIGFLLTAVPRRTRSASASATEIAIAAALLVAIAASLAAQLWVAGELAYLLLFALLLRFAIVRFVGASAERRPPAAFVLVPIGILHGVAGSLLVMLGLSDLAAPAMTTLGALMIQQGVFSCFTVGVGGLVLPLLAGEPPPADLASPRERRRAAIYGAAGVAILASFPLEVAGFARIAPLVRAAVIAIGLGVAGGAWRPPGKPGLHRRLVWISVWMMPLGLALSALFPDYRVPALHVVFIGGFALMSFGVATHVVLSHLELPELALGRPPAVALLALALLVALAARLAADWSHTYFEHLGWAGVAWIAGTAVWLAFVLPKVLRR